jgi:hypothetical protein
MAECAGGAGKTRHAASLRLGFGFSFQFDLAALGLD